MTSTASDDQFLPHQDDVDQAQPKRRPYNASASLSEYGIFPECDAAQAPAKGADVALPTEDEAAAHMYPTCLEWFKTGERCGEAWSIKVGNEAGQVTVPLFTMEQVRAAVLADRQQRGGDVIDVEAAAKKLAECMDYPWAEMPEQGCKRMREHAQAVVSAALAATKGESNG